jgi:hypothetical protein
MLMQTHKLINLHKLNNKLIDTSYNQKVLKLPCVRNSNSPPWPRKPFKGDHSPPYDIFVIDYENYIKIEFLRFSNTWEIFPRIDLY